MTRSDLYAPTAKAYAWRAQQQAAEREYQALTSANAVLSAEAFERAERRADGACCNARTIVAQCGDPTCDGCPHYSHREKPSSSPRRVPYGRDGKSAIVLGGHNLVSALPVTRRGDFPPIILYPVADLWRAWWVGPTETRRWRGHLTGVRP